MWVWVYSKMLPLLVQYIFTIKSLHRCTLQTLVPMHHCENLKNRNPLRSLSKGGGKGLTFLLSGNSPIYLADKHHRGSLLISLYNQCVRLQESNCKGKEGKRKWQWAKRESWKSGLGSAQKHEQNWTVNISPGLSGFYIHSLHRFVLLYSLQLNANGKKNSQYTQTLFCLDF